MDLIGFQAVLDGEVDQFAAGFHLQFAFDAIDVGADGFGADAETFAYL